MTKEYTVGVDGWFACGWNALRTHAGRLFGGVAVLLLYYIFLSAVGMVPGGGYIVIVVQLSAGLVLSAGWLLFCLRLVRDENPRIEVMFEPFSRFSQVWGISFGLSLLVAMGLFLFIIPGVYFMVRFGMAIFASVDRKLPPMEAAGFSSSLTEGHRLQLLIMYGIMLGLYGLSIFPYFVQMGSLGAVTVSIYNFVLTPLLGAAYASAYDSLVTVKGEVSQPPQA